MQYKNCPNQELEWNIAAVENWKLNINISLKKDCIYFEFYIEFGIASLFGGKRIQITSLIKKDT